MTDLQTSQSTDNPGRHLGLSPRQLQVLLLMVEGRSDREIAATLQISPRTVMTHVAHVLRKLDVRSRTAAAMVAVRQGLAWPGEPLPVSKIRDFTDSNSLPRA
ncbi:MAG: response regulator transcription factor [Dehalococcoidia bacterium]